MKKSSLNFKKYLAGIILVLVVAALIGLLKFGNLDKLKGKIKVKDVYLSNISTKLNANVLDASGEGPVVSNGYDEVSYELKYRLSDSDQRRDVIITGSLDSDNGYASFKKLVGENITSTLSNDNRNIEIVISNVPANTEITTNIALTINGAPNGYKVNPTFKIKETTAEEYTNFYTNPIEISTNNLRGTVINENGDKISDIIVSVFKNKKLIKETYTNSNGEYIISDLPEDSYTIRINEEIYKDPAIENVIVKGDTILNLNTERIYPFELKIHKYITRVDANNLGSLISKTYDRVSTVAFPIKKLTNLNGKVYYSIVVENTGEKEGIVSAVKDELPDFMEFDENENDGFELKNGYIYDRNLEGITLRPGEKVEDTLVLRIKNTNEARTYLNRVNALGEIYEHVVYILDGRTYKEEDVLEGEKTERPTDPVENFSGWYTDSEFTNKYNFNNLVTKDLILYGKTGQKYNVDFYDKDPETGDEELYTKKTVDGGKPVDEPNDHPEHTGYDFDYWCTTDFVEYNFNLPVNSDLKLINCTTIKKYDVNFYNYQDTVEKNVKIEYKKLVSQNDAPVLTEEPGYVFVCWTEDKQNCFDFTTPIVKKTDLYPKHEQLTNSVIFDDLGRTTVKENIPYGNTVEPVDNQGWEGHTFKCWSEDRINCFDFNTPIIDNKTLYAEYDINKYTVHFVDRNPETLEETQYGDDQIIEWGETATRPENDPYHYGYTFDSWEKDGTTYDFATPVKSDLTLISDYNINSYPVHFHDGNDVTTVSVVYKNKVTPITSPTKEHHIFTAWLKEDDTPFDFVNTLIVEETDLYSSYEEVLPPSISHAPTMWTNQNVTVTLSDNPSLVDNTGYSYLYKTSTTDYGTYTAPFTVDENTTVIAKGVKSEIDSVVTNHEIVNIDKLNPSVTLLSQNSVTKNAASLNVTVTDNESGVNYYEVYQDNVKVGERHFECYDETTFDGYEACRSSLPTERVTVYPVGNLTPSTTYTFKIKVYDKAGNFAWSDEIEVTTPTPRIVARLIGYNNNLFTDTVDDTTGDVIVPKEDKYINFESLAEAFDYEDLYDCKNVQCTIQMVTSTNESVQVLAGQDLTLDLNGKIVSGVNEEYTIKNNGDFTLIESTPEGEDTGKLVNNLGVALLNKADCSFTMGSGYSDIPVNTSVVSQTRPYIYGETVGVKTETNANFTMFDGKIVAPLSQTPGLGAVNGKVTGTEYSYEAVSNTATIDEREYQVVTLSQLVSPEARVNQSVYYARLATAMNNTNGGTVTPTTDSDTKNLMQDLKPKGAYSFEYDDATGTWRTNSYNDESRVSKSYFIIDLTDESNDKALNIDYELPNMSNYSSDPINRTCYYYDPVTGEHIQTRPAGVKVNVYNGIDSVGEEISPYAHSATNYSFELPKGDIYIVNIEHSSCGNNGYGDMIINDIALSDIEVRTDRVEPQSDLSLTTYGFYYDEHDKKIKSNNQYVSETSTAYGYVELDLTDKEGEYSLIVNTLMESYADNRNWDVSNYSEARISLNTDPNPNNGTTVQRTIAYASDYMDVPRTSLDRSQGDYGGFTTSGPRNYSTTITGGKKYYLTMSYIKTVKAEDNYPTREEYEAAGCRDQLIINSIDLVKKGETSTTVDITAQEPVENNLVESLVESSNGGLIITSEGKLRTNINSPGQSITSHVDIDLTNDTTGLLLSSDLLQLRGTEADYVQIGNGSNMYTSYIPLNYNWNINTQKYYNDTPECTNCFMVFQKRTSNTGVEEWYRIGGSSQTNEYYSSLGQNRSAFYIPLAGGYEYRVAFNVQITNKSMDTYPEIEFTSLNLTRLENVYGNYYNGISPSNPLSYIDGTNVSNNTVSVVSSNMAYPTEDTYRDSFVKLDLTNYDKDQLLTFFAGNKLQYGDFYVYLTNNNMALTEEALLANKQKLLLNTNENVSETITRGVVLQKGKIYYLHCAGLVKGNVASLPRSYPNPGVINYSYFANPLRDVKLTPIEESILAVGNVDVQTGTYNVTGLREEINIIPKRTTDEPIIHDNTDTIYGFEYNEETGWYDALNTQTGTIAAKVFKIDLTEATVDKVYSIQTNDGGSRNYYTFADSENIPTTDMGAYRTDYSEENPPKNYYTLKSHAASVTLEKGKVHYIQVLTYKPWDSIQPFSIKITEYTSENPTHDYTAVDEVTEFNTKVDTVQLLKDVNIEQALYIAPAKEVVLDLNGYNLSSNDEMVVDNAGDLTIKDDKYERMVASYESDLAEYREYAGLCDGCEPSAEYLLDQSLSKDFAYTGNYQEYTVPYTGTYKLQVWGAQGGYRSDSVKGGKGGYSEGLVELQAGETVYVYVGGSGRTGGKSGGFNGGGSRTAYYGGGGATDMRVEGNTLYHRIIVAGGGGSDGSTSNPGKAGGGLSGLSATESYGTGGTGGTQTDPGTNASFGQGGAGVAKSGGYGGAGGGGWYGGGGSTPDGSGDDDRGGGGGSGFIYTDSSTSPVEGYAVENHILTSAATYNGTESMPNYTGASSMTGNTGNGYAKITCIYSEELETIKNSLPKTYNVKTEPDISNGPAGLSSASATALINNQMGAKLTLENMSLNVSSKYGIYNVGTIETHASTNITITNNTGTGIANYGDGNIINNGNLNIKLDGACNTSRAYGTVGISYDGGSHNISNVNITGKNGSGIMVERVTDVNVYSSNININLDTCSNGFYYSNKDDYTELSSYDKNYSYYRNYYQCGRNFCDKTDGTILNKGNTSVVDGTTLVGKITNFGNLHISDGSNFNNIYQTDKSTLQYSEDIYENPNVDIYNTEANINQIVIRNGSINVVEEQGQTSTLTSSSTPTILNYGTMNTSGGEIASTYNLGTLNSNNTNFSKLYNLHTYSKSNFVRSGNAYYDKMSYNPFEEFKGISNINGGTISSNILVNESQMTIDGVNVPEGIVNRGDLTVKGNSTVTGTDKTAIYNSPFALRIYNGNKITSYGYSRTSVTLGDDDGTVTNGPTINTTGSSYAITGDCNSRGTSPVDFKFKLINNTNLSIDAYNDANLANGTYINSDGELVNFSGTRKTKATYPENADNLCELNYYDGNIQNTTVTDITDVVDIPINNVASGYDVYYDNSNLVGKVTLDTIDSSSRTNVIDVGGTPYKSLQTAINLAADNSIINITGNYDTANKVIIPEGKNLTINYATGSKVNSYSKNPLVTNNGGLTIIGDGSNNVIGITAFENNNNMTINGSNSTINVGNYYAQRNLVKNNASLTIDDVTSNGLDIITYTESSESPRNSLVVNNGVFKSNTIYGNNSNITLTGGYFDTDTNDNYFEINAAQATQHTKPLFNVNSSTVNINNFDVDTDSRYSSITTEQNLGLFDIASTLNLNNSKFGGKSSKDIYTVLLAGSTININDGTYDKLFVHLKGDNNNYNQTSGTVNGTLYISNFLIANAALGNSNTVNITGGRLISENESAIDLMNVAGTSITVGTKGDLVSGTSELNVSKTDPEIRGATYGISAGGTTSASNPNKLYFYDGIFKGNGNPIDLHVEEVETGYDIAFMRNKTPKEKYLDILPFILNYTTGTYYFDIQTAFDEANTDDVLIWIKDYTNFSYTPSLVIDQNKRFKVYFSYLKADETPGYQLAHTCQNHPSEDCSTIAVTPQDEFKPYSGTETVPSGYTVTAPFIAINNSDIVTDPATDKTEKTPFIINNGDVEFIAAATATSGSNDGLSIATNFESISGASIIRNNGTIDLKGITAVNVKALGTMFKNHGTMTISRGHFETIQTTILDNYGTLTLEGNEDDTFSCYVSNYIKVHRDSSLEELLKGTYINLKNVVGESIINNANATMNITYLHYNSDYLYIPILNNGTMTANSIVIEAYRDDNYAQTLSVRTGNPIINNGTMTASGYVVAPKGIINTGDLTFSGTVDGGFDTGITNSGTLIFSGSIYGAGKGIYDTGNTDIRGAGITTYREAYYGVGSGTISMLGGFNSYGKDVRNYSLSYETTTSCLNGEQVKTNINGTISNPKTNIDTLNNGVIYVSGRTLNIGNSGVSFMSSLQSITHPSSGCYKDDVYYETCNITPYVHENETTKNYTVSAVEAHDSVVNFTSGGISDGPSYTYGIYSRYSTINQYQGSIDSIYINNSTQDVNMGVKDGNPNETGFTMGTAYCSTAFKGINIYSGVVALDNNKLCHFNDKEDDYVIYKENGVYKLGQPPVVVNENSGVPYSSFDQAVSEASDGDTLRLLLSESNVIEDYDIEVNKNLTFDLNGEVLDANILVTGGEVTIDNGVSTTGRVAKVTNTSGIVNMTAGRVERFDNSSTLNITGGYISNLVNDSNGTVNLTEENISSSIQLNSATNAGTFNLTGNHPTYRSYISINEITNTGNLTLNKVNLNGTKIIDEETGLLTLENSEVKMVIINNSSLITMDYSSYITNLNIWGHWNSTLTLNAGTAKTISTNGNIILNGINATDVDINVGGSLIVNAGTFNKITCEGNTLTINNGNIGTLINDAGSSWGPATISNGTIGTINNRRGYIALEGGTVGKIVNTGSLRIGVKDGIVNTNSPVVRTVANNTYAITSGTDAYSFYYYDGVFTSRMNIVINASITEVEDGYTIYTAPDYDGEGNLTGTYSMTLRHVAETDTKIACVGGICYGTLQEAIDASVRNYTEDDGCPEVRIGDDFYFSVELDEDLVLDPQYTVSVNLNYHNLNDNGHNIPDNITLRNGSRNGTDLESSLSKFLGNVLGANDTSKDIIITKMEDGNALDTSKTYKLYKYDGDAYKPLKVNSDGAGKYSIGKSEETLKPIKGRVYINDLSTGEYMLKDDHNNELQFTVYENGTLSQNIKENNSNNNYGRLTASAVATLIVTIQTGITRYGYILLGIMFIIVIITALLLYRKNKSMKETI